MKKRPSFYINPFAPAGLFLLFFAFGKNERAAVLSSVTVHELSHLVAAYLAGQKCRSVTLTSFGINLGFTPPKTYINEIAIAAAGPFSSLFYAFTGYKCGGAFGYEVFMFSALFGIMNLIPLPSFDGYHILYGALSLLFKESTAQKAVYTVSLICLFIVWMISVYILFYSGINFVLLLFSSYVFAVAVIKKDLPFL